MRARRIAAVAAAALALSACAGEKVWMRSGAGPSDAEIDEMSCAEEAERSGVSVSIGGEASPPMDRFSQRYACLRARGYKLVPLEAEEATKLKSLGGAAKEDYWRELLTKRGFAAAPPRAAAPIVHPAPLPRPNGPAPAL
ncbi:hypothetical protein [Chenggangzhangella methanolivorans]|uniref:Lipoprotein n=1 Tax=Chenggangzhangella methanolivorans TaxID=1437009 RepID=A0A9E6UKW7_9HYPH|nr:hypothetical protein [Chenggangzhangella methanolivorans]QZN99881.1 hypothetical protein K6K41_25100 [Chenggangzhangella methanolivorans]